MEKIRFAARISTRDGAEYNGGGYPTLRQAIRGAQAQCEMLGGAEYRIHRWCPYTGYAEIVAGSNIPQTRLMRLAMLALGPIGRRNRNLRRDADITKVCQN